MQAITALRRLRMTGAQIAMVWACRCRRCRRASQNVTRRGRRRGEAPGREFVHVCLEDAARLAYVEVLGNEQGPTAAGFLRRAVASTPAGITVQRAMSDNGGLLAVHDSRCRLPAARTAQLRTRPYRPRTHGKAERLIRTMLSGWAYGAIYGTSAERTAALDGWLWTYNIADHTASSATSRPQPAYAS